MNKPVVVYSHCSAPVTTKTTPARTMRPPHARSCCFQGRSIRINPTTTAVPITRTNGRAFDVMDVKALFSPAELWADIIVYPAFAEPAHAHEATKYVL